VANYSLWDNDCQAIRGNAVKEKSIAKAVCLFSLLFALSAHAVDSGFSETIGGGLFCLDEIDQNFYINWISLRYGPPQKREGQAYWFDVTGEKLFGATLKYLFVGDGTSAYEFIGAVFEDAPADLVKKIGDYQGRKVAFQMNADGYASKTGSRIITNYDGGSKMYCAKKVE
jgi:hypothetical protein